MLKALTKEETELVRIVVDMFWTYLEDVEAVSLGHLSAWDFTATLGMGSSGSGAKDFEIPQENRLIGKMQRRDMFRQTLIAVTDHRDARVSRSLLRDFLIWAMRYEEGEPVDEQTLDTAKAISDTLRSGQWRGYNDLDALASERCVDVSSSVSLLRVVHRSKPA